MSLKREEVEKIIVENKDLIYHIAHRYLNSIDNYDIQDLYMEVALSFYETAKYYDESLNVDFKTFAYQNAMRKLGNLYRKQNALKRKAKSVTPYELQIGEQSTPFGDYIIVDNHSCDQVENMFFLEEVKKVAKEILTEKEFLIFSEYCKGYKVKEIAINLGYNEKTTSNILYKIKNKLKSAIKM